MLEVAPGVHMRFLRRAVMETLPDDDGAADPAGTDTADSTFHEETPEDTHRREHDGHRAAQRAPQRLRAGQRGSGYHRHGQHRGRPHRSGRAHRGLTGCPAPSVGPGDTRTEGQTRIGSPKR